MQKRAVDAVVISDLHLGTFGCHAQELLHYLKSISPRLLVLNGDILDMWQLSRHYFPASHMAVIKEIFELLTSGTRVIYVTGNHDELLRRYTDVELGNLQITDKLLIEIDGKQTWIFHGDVFDNTTRGTAKIWARLGSNGYALLLAFNRIINKCCRLIGHEPYSLSKKVMKQVNKSLIRILEFESKIAGIAIDKGYHYVICGHIHQPSRKDITNEKGSTVYLNSGDWVENLTALEYYNKEWHIYQHNEKDVTIKYVDPKRSTDVLTNEINIYLHTLNT